MCREQESFIEAFLHRYQGINHSLGPTVEKNPRSFTLYQHADKIENMVTPVLEDFQQIGIVTTLKHFPFSNLSGSSHSKTGREKLSLNQLQEQVEIFKRLTSKAGFIMTTHTFEEGLDPNNIVTFSSKWIDYLKTDIGFEGLILTDGLFMGLGSRPGGTVWDAKLVEHIVGKYDPSYFTRSFFAANAIIAGHDMIILEASANATYDVFNNIIYLASQDTSQSRQLRDRIKDSYGRIVKFKIKNRNSLLKIIDDSVELVDDAKKLREELKINRKNKKSDCEVNPSRFEIFRKAATQQGGEVLLYK